MKNLSSSMLLPHFLGQKGFPVDAPIASILVTSPSFLPIDDILDVNNLLFGPPLPTSIFRCSRGGDHDHDSPHATF